jgi:O-methyltransferase domain
MTLPAPLARLAPFVARELGWFRGAAAVDGALAAVLVDLGLAVQHDGSCDPVGGPPEGPAPEAAAIAAESLRTRIPIDPVDLSRPRVASWLGLGADLERTAALAGLVADAILPRFEKPGWLADLGGGVGLYTAALLSRTARASAVLVEQPIALEQAARFMAQLRNRVELRPADLTRSFTVGRPVRVALLADVLHLLPTDAAEALVHRSAQLLEPDGELVVVEIDAATPRGHLYALAARLLGGGLTLHPETEVRDWLARTGCRDAGTVRSQDAVILRARRPALETPLVDY